MKYYSIQEKAKIINEAFAPGVNVSEIRRKYRVGSACRLYAWRDQVISAGLYAGREKHTEKCIVGNKTKMTPLPESYGYVVAFDSGSITCLSWGGSTKEEACSIANKLQDNHRTNFRFYKIDQVIKAKIVQTVEFDGDDND